MAPEYGRRGRASRRAIANGLNRNPATAQGGKARYAAKVRGILAGTA
jgi:hypothetical protein